MRNTLLYIFNWIFENMYSRQKQIHQLAERVNQTFISILHYLYIKINIELDRVFRNKNLLKIPSYIKIGYIPNYIKIGCFTRELFRDDTRRQDCM